jgi:hypothetical protein
MEQLVALIFAFCEPHVNSVDEEVACQTYVTNCVIEKKTGWDRKNLARCEEEGMRTNWKNYSEL